MKRFKIYWFFRKLYDKYLRKKDESLIPDGMYCHGQLVQDPDNPMIKFCSDCCPYWSKNPYAQEQEDGYCSYLAEGDWEPTGTMLLWNQCKECGINEEDE
jgi:hypothetical protein